MKIFLLFLVFFLAPFDQAQGAQSAVLSNCYRILRSKVAVDPISVRDLENQRKVVEDSLREIGEQNLSTEERLLLADAREWLVRATEEAKARAEGKPAPPQQGFILGQTLLDGSGVLDGPRPTPFAPKRGILAAAVSDADLPTSQIFSTAEVRELVSAYQRGGESQFDGVAGRLEGKKGIDRSAKRSLEVQSNPILRDWLRSDNEYLLNIFLKDIDPENRATAAASFRENFSVENLRKKVAAAEAFTAEVARIRNLIATNPKLKNDVVEANSVDSYLLGELANFVPGEAFNPRDLPLPRNMKELVDAFKAEDNGVLAQQLNKTPSESDYLIEMANDSVLRPRLAAAARRDLTELSDATKVKTASGVQAVDIYFIGAGLHEQNMQNYLAQNDTGLSTLTSERNNVVTSTFANGDLAFNLNSSSKAENPAALRQLLGEGDLNFLPGGILQVNQFSQENNPPAQYWAHTAAINRAQAAGDIVFEDATSTVVRNTGNNAESYPYRILRASGEETLARAVVQTGIGNDVLPPIRGFREAYKAQFVPDANGQLPRQKIFTYTDFMAFVNSTNRPFSEFSNLRIGIKGAGDSGKAVLRWLIRKSNPQSYRRDAARIPPPQKIFWFGQVCDTCTTFIAENRTFYADLANAYRSGVLVPKDKSGTFQINEDASYRIGTQSANKDSTSSRSVEEDVDIIIVTTGFENPVNDIYKDITGAANMRPDEFMNASPYTRIVQGLEPSLGVVGVARQLVNKDGRPEDIYFLGPLAGEIVSRPELKSIDENSVANANHNWRSWRFIEGLSVRIQTLKASETASPTTGE